MKKKNNMGFTLIELLVAVAIMLSILGVAIVSFTSISDRKKEEAWQTVKGQIETAAEQYFKSNEYLFEGLHGGIEGTISIGKLVSDDYINVVTNPITGKKVSKCMVVKVIKTENGVFKATIDESTITANEEPDCDTDNKIVVHEVGAPQFVLEVEEGSLGPNNNNWYITDVVLSVNYDTNNEDNIIVKSECKMDGVNCASDIYEPSNMNININDDRKQTNYCITLTNNKGKTSKQCRTLGVDKTAPVITEIINPTYINGGNSKNVEDEALYNWINNSSDEKKIKLIATAEENISGIDYWQYKYTNTEFKSYSDSASTEFTTTSYSKNRNELTYLRTCDIAGNCSDSASTRIKIDTQNPKCELKLDGTKGQDEWYTSDVKIAFNEKVDVDKNSYQSGIQSYDLTASTIATYNNVSNVTQVSDTEGITYYGYVKDNAGNVEKCEINIKKDATPPACPTINILGTPGNLNWYKKGEVTFTNNNGKEYYFALNIMPIGDTTSWNWFTDNNGSLKDWGNNSGEKTKTLGDGERSASVVAYDRAGNTNSCNYNFNIDTTAPVITEINNPTYKNGGNVNAINKVSEDDYNWINNTLPPDDRKITLTARATENTSGIDYWQYSYNRDSDYNGYNGNEEYKEDKRTIITTPYTANRNQLTYLRTCDKAGNCSEPASTRIKIDKQAPTISVGLYKKTSINNISSSENLDVYRNDTWHNGWVFTKAEVSDNGSGIAATTYTTSGTTGSNRNVSGLYNNINTEGISTILYKTCDRAGNCVSSSNYTIKLDRTPPRFEVGLYKKTSLTNICNSKGLSSYTNNSWYNKGVFVKAMNINDEYSDVASTTYTTTGTYGSNSNVSGSYNNINTEGTSTIYYTVCDTANNCSNSSRYTINLDRTKPLGNLKLTTINSNYNSNKVNVEMSGRDDKSGIKTVMYTDSKGRLSYNPNQLEWLEKIPGRTLFDNLTKSVQKDTAQIVITDNAGNSETISTSYSTYALCSKKKESDPTYGNWGACSATCGGGTQTRTITKNFVDKYVSGQSCGTETASVTQECNTHSCARTCPKNIEVSKGTEGNAGWYIDDDIELSHDGEDDGYWTWYRGNTSLNTTTKTLTTGILEGTYNYTVKGKNGENCNSYEVKYDNTKPVIDSIYNPTYNKGDNAKNKEAETDYNWINNFSSPKSIELRLKATEETSGIDYWQYSYNRDSSYTKYDNSDSTEFTTTPYSKNRNELTYLRTCDKAGNCSEPASTRIKIDTINPECKISFNGTLGDNGWYTSGGTVRIEPGEDEATTGSGLNPNSASTFSLVKSDSSDRAYLHYAESFNEETDSTGITYYGYVKDIAGNEGACSKTIKLDKTNPSCEINPPDPDGENGWYINDVTLTLDSKGASYYDLTTSNTPSYNNGSSKTHSVETTSTGTTYYGYVKDESGRTGTCNKTIKLDKTDPTCDIVPSGTPGKNGWYISDVTLSLKTTGASEYDLSTSTTATYNKSTSVKHSVETTSAGTKYYGYVKDASGRTGKCDKTIKIDKTKPTCEFTCTGEKEGENGWMTGSSYTCTHTTTDTLSGPDSDYDKSYTDTTNKNEIKTVTSKDLAGNTSTCSYKIKYENPSTVMLGIYKERDKWDKCKFESPTTEITKYGGNLKFNSIDFYTAVVTTACNNRPGSVPLPIDYFAYSGATTKLIDGMEHLIVYQKGYVTDGSDDYCSISYDAGAKDYNYECSTCPEKYCLFKPDFGNVSLTKANWEYEDRALKIKSKAGNYSNIIRIKISYTETCKNKCD